MSTIYLDNLLKNENSPRSVPLDYYSSKKISSKKYSYSDLKLDLSFNTSNAASEVRTSKDVNAIYDIESINNSINNLFSYRPGFKYLNPELGINLEQFLFNPVNDFILNIIEEKIRYHLTVHEPRISLVSVTCTSIPDDNTINVKIFYNIIVSNLQSILNIKIKAQSQ